MKPKMDFFVVLIIPTRSDSTNDVIDSTALDHETNERNTTRKETQQDECTKFVARDGRECSDLWQKRAERAPPFAMPTATMWRTLFAALASRFTFRPDLSTFVRHDWKRRSTRKTRCAESRSLWQSAHRDRRLSARRRRQSSHRDACSFGDSVSSYGVHLSHRCRARRRAMRRFLLLIDNASRRTTRIATTCDMTSMPRSMRAADDGEVDEADDVNVASLSSSSKL